MINYIFQVIIFQLLFILIYDLFLAKETFFNKNRFYILSTVLISFILPFFKINNFQKVVSKESIIMLPEVILSPQNVIEKTSVYQSINYLNIIYISGLSVFLILFILKLSNIIRLILKHKRIKENHYSLILLPEKSKAFSFFNFIFISEEISKENKKKILAHELVHCKQKHTLDLLFFELMKIVMWFNPILYIYQKRISLVHEFISDEIASKYIQKTNYINSLISNLFQVENIAFVNQFYKESLIKKRIMMINKVTSKKEKQLKYLLLLPLLMSMVFYVSCVNEDETILEKQKMTIYMGSLNGEKITFEKETYMDEIHSVNAPTTKEYNLHDLTEEETIEYNSTVAEAKKRSLYSYNLRVFKGVDNRKVIFYNIKKAIEAEALKDEKSITDIKNEIIPFSKLEVIPTFLGCNTGDQDCFQKNITDFIKNNFDTEQINKLDLESGAKRIFVQFKIDAQGNVIDIESRAPNVTLKEYAEEIMKKLPKFKAGQIQGKNVTTIYTLPITFNVK